MKSIIFSLLIVCLSFSVAKADKGKGYVEVVTHAGHQSSQCGGRCCYIFLPGFGYPYFFHAPCMKFGTECTWTVGISIGGAVANSNGNIQEDIDGLEIGKHYDGTICFKGAFTEQTFYMPSRSIYLPAKNLYINIPEQGCQITTNDQGVIVYSVTNIVISNNALFVNE